MESIRIDVGVYTSLTIDLSVFNFTGIEKVVLTIKNTPSVKQDPIIEREFTLPQKYSITVSPEESVKLKNGAVYDLCKVIEGKMYKMSENQEVVLRRGVGDCIE